MPRIQDALTWLKSEIARMESSSQETGMQMRLLAQQREETQKQYESLLSEEQQLLRQLSTANAQRDQQTADLLTALASARTSLDKAKADLKMLEEKRKELSEKLENARTVTSPLQEEDALISAQVKQLTQVCEEKQRILNEVTEAGREWERLQLRWKTALEIRQGYLTKGTYTEEMLNEDECSDRREHCQKLLQEFHALTPRLENLENDSSLEETEQ